MSANLGFLSATDLLEIIREGKISSPELVDPYIQRIGGLDPIRRAAGIGFRGIRSASWIRQVTLARETYSRGIIQASHRDVMNQMGGYLVDDPREKALRDTAYPAVAKLGPGPSAEEACET
jgi:hypothetical protein